MTQNQDPLVYNASTGEWQNASNPYSGGVPLGLSIGDPIGSIISLTPSTGDTVSIDGGTQAIIESALQVASGAASENSPGFQASLVFHPGAVNEQLGHLTVSGLNASSAQAVLMTSESSDGSIHGAVKHGTISPSGGATYNFTTIHSFYPHSSIMQTGAGGWGIYATDQYGGSNAAEGWTNFGTPGLQNGFTSNDAGEYVAAFRYSPLHSGVVFFRGVLITPASGNVNSVVCCTLPANYRPAANTRWAVNQLNNAISVTGNAYGVLDTSGTIQFRALAASNSVPVDITGHVHIGP